MVRWPVPGSRFLVDVTRRAAAGHAVACQDQVDAQARVAPKTGGAVIPPAEHALWLFEFAKHVGQAEVDELAECLAFEWAAENRVSPLVRIVDVFVRGRDVEVAENDKVLVLCQLRLEEVAQGGKPVELVCVLSDPTSAPFGT